MLPDKSGASNDVHLKSVADNQPLIVHEAEANSIGLSGCRIAGRMLDWVRLDTNSRLSVLYSPEGTLAGGYELGQHSGICFRLDSRLRGNDVFHAPGGFATMAGASNRRDQAV